MFNHPLARGKLCLLLLKLEDLRLLLLPVCTVSMIVHWGTHRRWWWSWRWRRCGCGGHRHDPNPKTEHFFINRRLPIPPSPSQRNVTVGAIISFRNSRAAKNANRCGTVSGAVNQSFVLWGSVPNQNGVHTADTGVLHLCTGVLEREDACTYRLRSAALLDCSVQRFLGRVDHERDPATDLRVASSTVVRKADCGERARGERVCDGKGAMRGQESSSVTLLAARHREL